MSSLTLAQAAIVVDQALAEARRHGFAPMSVVVLDAGAHPIAMKREDTCGLLRHPIALAKAAGALGMGYNSRELARRAQGSPVFYTALFAVSEGAMAPSPGGVLIRDTAGLVIGAVGASGDTGDSDEICAIAGVLAAGLTPDPLAPPPKT